TINSISACSPHKKIRPSSFAIRYSFVIRHSDFVIHFMTAFILRRLATMLLVLFCVVSLTFLLSRLAPGSPFDRERTPPPWILTRLLEKYQLSGTLWQQYTAYMGDVIHGNLRVSFRYRNRTVNELL